MSNQGVEETMFRSHLLPSEHRKLVRLVGKRCMVKCRLSGVETKGLWDTGAMVSGCSDRWLEENHPDLPIRSIDELIDEDLDIRAANQRNMSCIGWVELDFQLLSSDNVLKVPFLVLREDIPDPIVGFNVIFELLKTNDVDLVQELKHAMELEDDKFQQAINIVQASGNNSLCSVKTEKKKVVVGAGQLVKLHCRAPVGYLDENTPVLFEPDEVQDWPEELVVNDKLLMLRKGLRRKVVITLANSSDHDVTIPPNTLLGRLELVSSVTPVEVVCKELRQEGEQPSAQSDAVGAAEVSVGAKSDNKSTLLVLQASGDRPLNISTLHIKGRHPWNYVLEHWFFGQA